MERKQDSFFLRNKKSQGKNTTIAEKPKSSAEISRQNTYDNNRPALQAKKEDDGKAPFDKKAYRLKKYSKKYKLEQWEEKRKKKLLYDYHKTIKNDPMLGSYKPKSFDEDNTDANDHAIGKFVRHPDLIEEKKVEKGKKDPYKKAKEHLEKVKQEKLQKQQEKEKSKLEKAQKLQEYKKKKQDRFKKLSKKTKRGQPVMTGRLELLLEKIQNV